MLSTVNHISYTALLIFVMAVSVGAQERTVSKIMAEGESLLSSGKALKASALFTEAIDAGAKAPGYSARARAWYELDRMDRFILDVETALDLDEEHAYSHFQRALYAMRSRDWSLARSSCDRAIRLGIDTKNIAEVRTLRGEALAKLGKGAEAIEDLEYGLQHGELDAEVLRLLASIHHDLGQHEKAITVLEQLLTTSGSELSDRINLGFEKASLGRHRDAIADYTIVLDVEKNNPVALSNYAYSLYKLGQNEIAMEYVRKSLRVLPSNPHALRTRGLLYLSLGNKELACKDLYDAKIRGGFEELTEIIAKQCGGVKLR